MTSVRTADTDRFYELLSRLAERLGGPRRLRECTGVRTAGHRTVCTSSTRPARHGPMGAHAWCESAPTHSRQQARPSCGPGWPSTGVDSVATTPVAATTVAPSSDATSAPDSSPAEIGPKGSSRRGSPPAPDQGGLSPRHSSSGRSQRPHRCHALPMATCARQRRPGHHRAPQHRAALTARRRRRQSKCSLARPQRSGHEDPRVRTLERQPRT